MSDKKITILYLDDEENNLTSFKAAFRREYKIFTTTTAQEAVRILSDNEIHIVISDQKMPNISGVEFFELIVQDFPEPIRMLLTGYADIEAVIDAINKGQVYRYIAKPWNETELQMTINNAYETFVSRRQLKKKNEELEKAYNELEKFVYSASHDLRAPLVSVLGVIKLARAESPDAKSMEYLEMIEQSVGKLDGFVQNIINYYQNRKKEEIIVPINFDSLADEVMSHHSHAEGASVVEFRKTIAQANDFQSDEMRLKMILNNLVSNAIKYRDESKEKPFFELSVEADSENARVIISDNGIGIESEHAGRIFDMFYRSTDNNSLGTGIGLYIVKEAVEKLGGTISAESQPGEGAQFIVEIPNRS